MGPHPVRVILCRVSKISLGIRGGGGCGRPMSFCTIPVLRVGPLPWFFLCWLIPYFTNIKRNWLVVLNMFVIPYIENNHPNSTDYFFRGVQTTNQEIYIVLYTRTSWICWCWSFLISQLIRLGNLLVIFLLVGHILSKSKYWLVKSTCAMVTTWDIHSYWGPFIH